MPDEDCGAVPTEEILQANVALVSLVRDHMNGPLAHVDTETAGSWLANWARTFDDLLAMAARPGCATSDPAASAQLIHSLDKILCHLLPFVRPYGEHPAACAKLEPFVQLVLTEGPRYWAPVLIKMHGHIEGWCAGAPTR